MDKHLFPGGCLGVKGIVSRLDWALFAYMNRSTPEQESRPVLNILGVSSDYPSK
jgi:hypothetical protein